MKYHKIPQIGEITKFAIPPEYQVFNREVIERIILTLSEYWRMRNGAHKYPDFDLFRKLTWQPNVTKGGPFLNRLKKEVKINWGMNIPHEISRDIGNLIGLNSASMETYCFDFVQSFDWQAGQFGDGGSCFWQNRKGIRTAMEKEGNFYAIRFYKRFAKGQTFLTTTSSLFNGLLISKIEPYKSDDTFDYFGVGRSWLYETMVKTTKGKLVTSVPIIIIFNSYGLSIQEQSLVLASYLKKGRHTVYLTNKEKVHGGLYMNGSGFAIGDENLVSHIGKFDFGLANEFDMLSDDTFPMEEAIEHAFFADNKRKPSTKKDRILAKANRKRMISRATFDRDYDKGILHQRLTTKLTDHINIERYRFFVSVNMDKERAKIIKRVDFNPLRLINHDITNQIRKDQNGQS